jgi:hypothetical protein
MAEYNGHRSWAAWNVALWIANDEGLYRLALLRLRQHKTKSAAARTLIDELPTRTPDGARYSFTSVREALVGLE